MYSGHGMLPVQGHVRMTSSASVPSTQATMAQLASMTQGFPAQHPHHQGMMMRPGARPPYMQQHSGGGVPPGHMMTQVMPGASTGQAMQGGQPMRGMTRMINHSQVSRH